MSYDWKYRDPDELAWWIKAWDYVPELLLLATFIAVVAQGYQFGVQLERLAIPINAMAYEGIACPKGVQ